MKSIVPFTLAAAAMLLNLFGCIFSPTKTDNPPPTARYAQQTAPESVVVNLVTSYRFREIEEYAKLLAPEFIFKFQADDVAELGLEDEFWTHDEDSTGTRNLFTTNQVSNIQISLEPGLVEDSPILSHPPGTKKIRIIQTELTVDQTDGLTWVVSDQQDMFFRRGNGSSAAEDTTLWFLMEWQDLDSGIAAPGPPLASLSDGDQSPTVVAASWGRLLQDRASARTP